MRLDRVFIILLFITSVIVAFRAGGIQVELQDYFIALFLFYTFSTLYYHLKVVVKQGSSTIDYTIPYSLGIALFVGPFGAFFYEALYMFTVYGIRKATKIADDEELLHTFYNTGAFALNGAIGYYLFQALNPIFANIPFGFWILIITIVIIMSYLSHIYLSIVFLLMGEIKTMKEALSFIKSRSILDIGKIAFSNGLLFVFLESKQWEMVVGLFLLNYLVSRSNIAINQTLQHKLERDKYEQMAYTDFLTGLYNRTFMDKKMDELNNSKEPLGIIVSDIDSFKLINDSYNHAVGDRAIQHFAATVQSFLREDDYLFRSGGEEFTIFLRNRSYEECFALVEEIRDGIKNTPAIAEYNNEAIQIPMTASFGLYYYKTNDALDIKRAYVYADQLLIKSKDLGKNRISAKNGIADIPLSSRYQ
ncbi:GGDEF domain-containing protein [Ornithinibacillus californiensis]|uniref:GGDEF domain-containing protein n=1 Tax=Ornithinibacillus californiensis TaxID=161536 RepID=UPI00064DE081|nr:GGDEF domain-containing protein [Ornithinibacillus californiensis]